MASVVKEELAMATVSATELKNRLGRYLHDLSGEPVVVEKAGQPVAVLLSYAEYERLEAIEDHYWGQRALAAAEEDSLGDAESMEYLRRRFFARDPDAAD